MRLNLGGLVPSWEPLGRSWAILGTSWDGLGHLWVCCMKGCFPYNRILEDLGAILGHLGASWNNFGTILEPKEHPRNTLLAASRLAAILGQGPDLPKLNAT